MADVVGMHPWFLRRSYRVQASGVELHVVEAGDPGAPPLLLVHGFPDDHEVFSRMFDELAKSFHVATFDMRGVGQSSAPRSRRGYRVNEVLSDIDAVIDRVYGEDASVHVFGHDWGSVLLWSYITDSARALRVRSFVSVSGPHIALMWESLYRTLRGERRGELGGVEAGLHQLVSSWYTLALQLPLLPELVIRRRGAEILHRAFRLGGVPKDDPYFKQSKAEVVERMQHAIGLYRANVLRPPAKPQPDSIHTPIKLVIPEHDPFVRPSVYAFIDEYATNIDVQPVSGSHWLVRSHANMLVNLVREFTQDIDMSAPNCKTSG